jgi:hypothetical protein
MEKQAEEKMLRQIKEICEYSARTGDREPVRYIEALIEYAVEQSKAGKPPPNIFELKGIIAKRLAKKAKA